MKGDRFGFVIQGRQCCSRTGKGVGMVVSNDTLPVSHGILVVVRTISGIINFSEVR